MIGPEIDEAYLAAVLGERVLPAPMQAAADALKIVYTPLNGAGTGWCLRRCGAWG